MPPTETFSADIAGLDALDVPVLPAPSGARRFWTSAWPRLAAIVVAIAGWELITVLKVKPSYVLPGPGPVFARLWKDIGNGVLLHATAHTMWRAAIGYSIAVVVGSAVGIVVARSRVVRAAIGSLLTGLQTMPTIAWFPFAILLFGLSETAIISVVILGAAPAIANGLISGVDNIPPILLRAGRVLGAKGLSSYRHVVIPAALPGFVGGLKQGWAFAWRSLMAGELLVLLGSSLGVVLQNDRDNSDAAGLIATMIVILVIGIVVDSLVFARAETAIRKRWGLLGN